MMTATEIKLTNLSADLDVAKVRATRSGKLADTLRVRAIKEEMGELLCGMPVDETVAALRR